MKLPVYGAPDGNAELRAYAALAAESYAGDRDAFERRLSAFRDGGIRVLRRGSRCVAGALHFDFAQYFGGKAVPARGLAAVAVAPHLRGGGLAREVLHSWLKEACDDGVALAPLYPAAQRLYRSLEWELAGTRVTYQFRPADLPARHGKVRPATDDDEALIRDLHARSRSVANGPLKRCPELWQRLRASAPDLPAFAYIAEDGGYVLYALRREPPGVRFRIEVRELVALNRPALHALLALLAGQRSVCSSIPMVLAPFDPALPAIQPDHICSVHERLEWMLRVVNLSQAVQGRGWPHGMSAKVAFTLEDVMLPANAGAWTLQLARGRASLKRGGRGGPRLEPGGLAALYSSRSTPAELRALGLLSGPESQDAALAAVFAGPAPWMPDFF